MAVVGCGNLQNAEAPIPYPDRGLAPSFSIACLRGGVNGNRRQGRRPALNTVATRYVDAVTRLLEAIVKLKKAFRKLRK